MSPQMTSSCDIIIINIIIIVMIVQFLLYERYLIQFSIRRNKAFLLSHSHARRKRKINVTARTHLGAFYRPERQRAEDTRTVERVESDRPLSIRLPLYGRKVVGGLERIDTLATAGEKKETFLEKKKTANRVISFDFTPRKNSRSLRETRGDRKGWKG